ncbi:MAG: hypothetical protein IPM94_04595 [bacterium]|nr:hypothetical protein [bacterium]
MLRNSPPLKDSRRAVRAFARAGLLASLLPLVAGCGGSRVEFPYSRESLVFPPSQSRLPRIQLLPVADARPPAQREGQGHFVGITFPDDASWNRPVTEMYRGALLQDIEQTSLAEAVPLSTQADYTLEATVHSFHCRMERSGLAYALPVGVGLVGGFFWGDDASSKVKRGLVLAVAAMGALPAPLRLRAEAEVELVLRDRAGRELWRQDCLGEIVDDAGEPVVSRRDAHFAQRLLPQAVKRCNACLLGQLRQWLTEHPLDGG